MNKVHNSILTYFRNFEFLQGHQNWAIFKNLIIEYKEFHEPIREYLFTSPGIDLQNTDSKIMEEILMELHRRGILGLPIHDSVIVEAQHEGLLKDLMIQAYRKFMDFEPVLKVAWLSWLISSPAVNGSWI